MGTLAIVKFLLQYGWGTIFQTYFKKKLSLRWYVDNVVKMNTNYTDNMVATSTNMHVLAIKLKVELKLIKCILHATLRQVFLEVKPPPDLEV